MAQPRKRTKLQEARERMYRELVFESAERVFAERGFDQCTMQEVAAEAGISLKTLYGVFPGKNELYREILEVRGREFFESIAPEVGDGSALERLEAGTRAYVAYLLGHDAYFRILLHQGRAWGLDPRGLEAREAARAGGALVAAVLRQGMDEGRFRRADPEMLAGMVQALLQVQLAHLVERGESDADAICGEILVSLRRLLLAEGEEPARPAA